MTKGKLNGAGRIAVALGVLTLLGTAFGTAIYFGQDKGVIQSHITHCEKQWEGQGEMNLKLATTLGEMRTDIIWIRRELEDGR